MAERASRADSAAGELSDATPSRSGSRLRDILLALATFGMLAAGAAWVLRPPRATLGQAQALINKGEIDNAAIRILRYLAERPEDVEGYRLLSSLLDRESPAADPSRILEGLSRLSPRNAVARSFLALDRGKASYRLARYDDAEASWLEALRIDPTVPEAAWTLLGLYDFQGRDRDARGLALCAISGRTRPAIGSYSFCKRFLPKRNRPIRRRSRRLYSGSNRENPRDRRSMIALGLALVNNSRTDEGLAILIDQARFHDSPDDPDAADLDAIEALLIGLNAAGDVNGLAYFLKSLPPKTADSDRLAWFQGRVAESRRDWKTAAIDFELRDPHGFARFEGSSRSLPSPPTSPETLRPRLGGGRRDRPIQTS